eukprot:scaffold68265_cov60-Phaeocystis_antarctica.AAC.2
MEQALPLGCKGLQGARYGVIGRGRRGAPPWRGAPCRSASPRRSRAPALLGLVVARRVPQVFGDVVEPSLDLAHQALALLASVVLREEELLGPLLLLLLHRHLLLLPYLRRLGRAHVERHHLLERAVAASLERLADGVADGSELDLGARVARHQRARQRVHVLAEALERLDQMVRDRAELAGEVVELLGRSALEALVPAGGGILHDAEDLLDPAHHLVVAHLLIDDHDLRGRRLRRRQRSSWRRWLRLRLDRRRRPERAPRPSVRRLAQSGRDPRRERLQLVALRRVREQR